MNTVVLTHCSQMCFVTKQYEQALGLKEMEPLNRTNIAQIKKWFDAFVHCFSIL